MARQKNEKGEELFTIDEVMGMIWSQNEYVREFKVSRTTLYRRLGDGRLKKADIHAKQNFVLVKE